MARNKAAQDMANDKLDDPMFTDLADEDANQALGIHQDKRRSILSSLSDAKTSKRASKLYQK